MPWPSRQLPPSSRQALLDKQVAVAALRHFLDGSGTRWEWEDFISLSLDTPELDEVRRFCAAAAVLFPSQEAGPYCSLDGLAAMTAILARLEAELRSEAP